MIIIIITIIIIDKEIDDIMLNSDRTMQDLYDYCGKVCPVPGR